jgi:hypothetical protein
VARVADRLVVVRQRDERAIAMPTAATWFPDLAVRGEESRFRPMMKSAAARR